MTTEAKQTIARISAFTSRAIERLQTGKPGDTVTADQMRDVIGMDCRSRDKGYSYVRSAIHHVESQHGIVWAWDRDGDQWKCLDTQSKAESVDGFIKQARRRIRAGLRRGKAVNEAELTDEQLREHRLRTAVVGTMDLFTSGGTRQRLESASKVGTLVITDPAKIVDLMKR